MLETRLVAFDRLQTFVQRVLVAADVPEQDAAIVAECLVTANLSGIDTHGVVRLAHYINRLGNGTIKTHPKLCFEQVAPAMGSMRTPASKGVYLKTVWKKRLMKKKAPIMAKEIMVNATLAPVNDIFLKK